MRRQFERSWILCLFLALMAGPSGAAWPEVGENDFLIGSAGLQETPLDVEVAVDTTRDRYLVLWWQFDGAGGGGLELLAQVVDADGVVLGLRQSLASQAFGQYVRATAAYSPLHDRFLIAYWSSELERILVQLVAADGQPTGPALPFEDSCSQSPGGSLPCELGLAYNPAGDTFVLVWRQVVGGPASSIVRAAAISGATGMPQGNGIQISSSGTYCTDPSVVYNSVAGEFLAAWEANGEIFGRRMGSGGLPLDAADLPISHMDGPLGDAAYRAMGPSVAHNPTDNEYLVTWWGDDGTIPLIDEEFEVFGQRLDAAALEIGDDDFRISDLGGSREATYDAEAPRVAYLESRGLYFVAWHGDDDVGGLVDDEFEIFGQFLDREGREIGPNDVRLSQVGGTGTQFPIGRYPALAASESSEEFLAVWEGPELRGQRIDTQFTIFVDGFESGNFGSWSLVVP